MFQPLIFRGVFNICARSDLMKVPTSSCVVLQGTAAEDVRIDNQCLGSIRFDMNDLQVAFVIGSGNGYIPED